jgi:peptide/nickel transport system ATP-binding protein
MISGLGTSTRETLLPLLVVHDLYVEFITRDGTVRALNGVSVSVDAGQVLAILGESGSGKSVTLRSILGLHARGNTRVTGQVLLKGHDVNAMSDRERQAYRGRVVSMVFQEPLTALDPVFRIGQQIVETLVRHRAMAGGEALRRARELLDIVQVPSPERVLNCYPHEISGGMRQRAMIAIALACEPELLLADEPTTALDVTVQAQILWLLRDLQRRLGLAVIFVTHDLGVAAEVADHAAVMYAGRVVEQAPITELFARPAHPYTEGLMRATVRRGQKGTPLIPIPGAPPNMAALPPGCAFAARCPLAREECVTIAPELHTVGPAHRARCHLVLERFGPLAEAALATSPDAVP